MVGERTRTGELGRSGGIGEVLVIAAAGAELLGTTTSPFGLRSTALTPVENVRRGWA